MTTPDPPALDLRALRLAVLEALERGEPLSPWLAAYPEHAALLADLAAGAPPATPAPPDQVAATAAIMRQTLHTHLHPAGAPPRRANPLTRRGLDFPEAARRLRLPIEILLKIDRQMILVQTVPTHLLAQLAELLGCPAEVLRADLATLHPETREPPYQARRPPEGGQQTFAAAVEASETISPADRRYWMGVLADPGSGPLDAPAAGAPASPAE